MVQREFNEKIEVCYKYNKAEDRWGETASGMKYRGKLTFVTFLIVDSPLECFRLMNCFNALRSAELRLS
jgi:hypothetical protein